MRYLPIAIDSRGKSLVIFGGGRSAIIKLKTFLKAEFSIRVVARKFIDEFYDLEDKYKDRLTLFEENVDSGYGDFSCDYMVIATDDLQLNDILRQRAKALKIPVLDTTNPDQSDFILNKIVEKNNISLSISTGGKAPGLSKHLARELSDFLDGLDHEKIDLIIELREALKNNNKSIKEGMTRAYGMEKNELRRYIKNIYEDKNRN